MSTPAYASPQSSSTGSVLWKAFKLVLLLSLASCCCCGLGLTALGSMLEPLPEEAEQQRESQREDALEDSREVVPEPPAWEEKGVRGQVQLAAATVPEDSEAGEGTTQSFAFRAKHTLPAPHQYRARFTEAEASRLKDLHEELGRQMHYQSLKDSMRFQAPDECFEDYKCIYTEVWSHNEAAVRALVRPFRERIDEQGLTTLEAADLVLSFVQSLPYLESNDYAFDVTPAALVVHDRGGDCDSKTVLGLMLLRELGIDGVLLMSKDKSHAALGLGLPVTGEHVRHRGTKYVFVEMTEVAPFGFMPSRTGRVSQYFPVELP